MFEIPKLVANGKKFPVLKNPASFTQEEKDYIYSLQKEKARKLENVFKLVTINKHPDYREDCGVLEDSIYCHPPAHLEGKLDKDFVSKEWFFSTLYYAEEWLDDMIGVPVEPYIAKEILRLMEEKYEKK